MPQRIGFRTEERTVVGFLGTEAKRSMDIARRRVWFIHDDGTEKEADYDNPSFGNSANTLLMAQDGGKLYAAVGIEFKPGLLPDNTDSTKLPVRVLTTPSGIRVTIPAGAVVSVFGGYYKADEAARMGALRELKEESGYESVELFFLGRLLLKPAWMTAVDDLFLAFGDKQDFSVVTDISISKRHWLPFVDVFWLMQQLSGFGAAPQDVGCGAHYPAHAAVMQSAIYLAQMGLVDMNDLLMSVHAPAAVAAA